MLKRILLILLAVVAAFSGYVALQPSDFRIERSAIVVAPQANTFAEVNDFHNWQEWSPWAKLDPNAKGTFEGPVSGEGAVFRWAGNDEVGEGSMTLTESKPDERVRIRVDFVKPWTGTNNSEFTFKPDGPRTLVTWAIYGEQGFLGKAICLFMNPQKMIGEPMEKGLANLKTRVEGKSAPATADPT
ncbi:MAG: SRPBCC family protein [Hyphomicrobium sp.]|uniref:SRPBCC family protein n=1 Tax=Hyphomicrobium sp. TaxID=82 RepID=UPI003D0A1C95